MKRTAKIFNKKIIAALVVIFALLIIASSRNALLDSYREQKRWQHFEDNLQDIGYVHNGHEIGLLLEQDKKWQPTLDDYKKIYQYVYGYDLVPWRKLDGTNMSPIIDLVDENGQPVFNSNGTPVKTRINLIPQWEQEYNLAVERGENEGNVIAELRDSTRNLVVNGDLFVQENEQISQAEFLKDKFRDLLGMLIQTVWAAPFFSDTFTESSATWLPDHTPDTGTDWAHLTSRFTCDLYINPSTDTLSGAQSVTSGGCSVSGGEGEMNYVTDSLSSYDYEVTAYQTNGDTGDDMNLIGCRANTDFDGYFVRWNESDADMYGCSNGFCGVVVSGAVGVADTSTVKLKCDSSIITFWENDTLLLSYTESTFATGQPVLGMGAITNFNEDDDVDLQELDNFNISYVTEPWWDTDFSYRKRIIYDNSAQSTGLQNFPVVATSTSADTGFWSHVQADYRDLRFINDDGNELYFEIEEFDYSGNDMTAWVKLPFAHATTSDSVWMYYGNAGAATSSMLSASNVWDSNFMGVWHLDETSGSFNDSTQYVNHGTWVDSGGEGVRGTSGAVGPAVDFDGDDVGDDGAYIDITHDTELNPGTGDWTIMFWAAPLNANQLTAPISKLQNGGNYEGYLVTFGSDCETSGQNICGLMLEDTSDYVQEVSTADVVDGNWHYYGYTFINSSDSMTLYREGQSISSTNSSPGSISNINNTTNVQIAGLFDASEVEYAMDEMRLSNIARSADWIAFEYCNMSGGCNTYGAEESVPSTPLSISSATDTPDPTNPSRSVTFIVDWTGGSGSVKAKICANSSGLTNQLCDSGSNWASSTAFTTDDPISLKYNVVEGDHGQTRNYYVYVCDDSASCTDVSSGTFSVNLQSVVPNIKVRGGFKLR